VYAKADGTIFPPGEESWAGVKQTYSVFTKYHHEPYFLCCYELDDGSGWAMSGNAWLYCSLPGEESDSVTDGKGQKFQMRVPAGFHFVYKKTGENGAIQIATTSITSDSGPIVVALLQRGIMKPADLGL